ncbi:hypothetical protein M011DRAFT_455792 [Sporormia fimetaria CBS 119925]|uniref:EthD domain-containing protein n=1 Tax=Sporormia fimetaria CBS 119925 TaxID=1340428 RepID=A0A6A6VJN5_9PLEO|nr:hypothetical protein M011DRAFT_455792 [Sporormia fimetaria CBS 119925]
MSSHGATATVLYPRKDGATFNMDYYLSTHMELVSKYWKQHGLKSWSVTQLGPDSPYSVQANLEWESTDSLQNAMKDEGTKEIMEDVPKFSSESPVLIAGGVVARG